MRRFISCGLLCSLALALPVQGEPAGPAGAPVVESLRVGLTEGRTRLVFDTEGRGDFRMFTLEEPARVVIDFPGAQARFDHRNVSVLGTPVARIRSGVQPDGSLRYVFDLRGPVSPKAFPVGPDERRGHRVVLDLYEESALAATATGSQAVPTPAPTAPSPARERTPPTVTPRDATEIPSPKGESLSGEWSGSIGLQARLFPEDPAFDGQDEQNISISVEPEYYIDWDNGRQRFSFHGFARADANDDERTHADLREFYWRMERDQVIVKAGIDVEFWGVTESKHLVDIINQTDRVENIDREDKLGQPMLNVDYLSDSMGTWQAWVLPYFRERTFPGDDGRLRINPPVDTDDPIWESGDEEEHIDFALRWSHFIGDWDVGIAHFTGTAREPLLVPVFADGRLVVRPFYPQIDQTSLDVQATIEAWLWKLEAIYNDNSVDSFYAATGGWEYTLFGVADSSADLGWLLEYHYDDRGETLQEALQNDLYTGLRWTGNDVAGTRLLAGFTVDLDNGSTFGNVEAVRRLGDEWTITLEARTFLNTDDEDPLNFFRDDSYLEIQLDRFF